MRVRLREADCFQTAFPEAPGELRPEPLFQGESVTANPVKAAARAAPEDKWRTVRTSHSRPKPGTQCQESIQYP